MQLKPDESKKQQQDFEAAFQEDPAPKPEQSEDEAFGLVPPGAESEEPGNTSAAAGPAVAIVLASDKPAEGEQANGESVPTGEPGAAPNDHTAAKEGDDIEKERQRLKSWEGRLKAQQADLDAQRAEIDSKRGEETPAGEASETPAQEAAEQNMSLVDAEQRIKEDFGDEFLATIKAVVRGEAAKVAGEHVENVGKKISEIIEDINDSKARAHFERIYDAHPDFMELFENKEFQDWVAADPERAQIVKAGSFRQVNKLLDDFKTQAKKPDESSDNGAPAASDTAASSEDAAALAAAEGVRSGPGMRLPEEPPMDDDYAKAWESA